VVVVHGSWFLILGCGGTSGCGGSSSSSGGGRWH